MPASPDVLSVLHLLVLSAFVGVTSVAMLVALISRLRIQRTLLVWRTGPVTGIPIGPSLFLGLVAAALGYSAWTGVSVPTHVLIGYPAGGLFWFAATWLARSVVVTEYGMIHDVSRISRAVAWGQVVDYFTTHRDGRLLFVFLYLDDDDTRQRLDLHVPETHAGPFHHIVDRKLDARFQFSAKQAFDEETLDETGGEFGAAGP